MAHQQQNWNPQQAWMQAQHYSQSTANMNHSQLQPMNMMPMNMMHEMSQSVNNLNAGFVNNNMGQMPPYQQQQLVYGQHLGQQPQQPQPMQQYEEPSLMVDPLQQMQMLSVSQRGFEQPNQQWGQQVQMGGGSARSLGSAGQNYAPQQQLQPQAQPWFASPSSPHLLTPNQQRMQQQAPPNANYAMSEAASEPAQALPEPSVEDKNADFVARVKAQRAAQKKAQTIQTDFDKEANNKVTLFRKSALQKAQVLKVAQSLDSKKKKKKKVELPDSGLSEQQLFAKYRIQGHERAGSNAFSHKIKIVKDVAYGKQYALKSLKKKGTAPKEMTAFKKAIVCLSKLQNHPNIYKLYDFCESTHGLYMVLEFCHGGNLLNRLEQCKNFAEHEAKNICKQVIAGICYFHSFNIVHRDLKLDNLMYNNGVVKITHFGMAADCSHGALGTPCGTLHFTAPEVLNSAVNYHTKADIWSFGVIVYMLLTGFPPFHDPSGNQQKIVEAINRAQIHFVPMFFGHCHPSVQQLISQCCCVQPQQRLSADQVREHSWFGVPSKPGSQSRLPDTSNVSNPMSWTQSMSQSQQSLSHHSQQSHPSQAFSASQNTGSYAQQQQQQPPPQQQQPGSFNNYGGGGVSMPQPQQPQQSQIQPQPNHQYYNNNASFGAPFPPSNQNQFGNYGNGAPMSPNHSQAAFFGPGAPPQQYQQQQQQQYQQVSSPHNGFQQQQQQYPQMGSPHNGQMSYQYPMQYGNQQQFSYNQY